MNFLKNIPPNIFTTSAFAIGLILTDDLNANELNSIGNWFMLIGQVLETNAAQLQVINSNNNLNNKFDNNYQVNLMKKVRDAIDKQINNLQ